MGTRYALPAVIFFAFGSGAHGSHAPQGGQPIPVIRGEAPVTKVPQILRLSVDGGSCSGTIIGKGPAGQAILSTAGHCFLDKGATPKAEYAATFRTADGKRGKATCRLHPGYTYYDSSDDLALCTTEEAVATEEACIAKISSGQAIALVGYGRHIKGQYSDGNQRTGRSRVGSRGTYIETESDSTFIDHGDSGGFMGLLPATPGTGRVRIAGVNVSSYTQRTGQSYRLGWINGYQTWIPVPNSGTVRGVSQAVPLTSERNLAVLRDYVRRVPGSEICGLDPGGLRIRSVTAGEPAATNGLRAGDTVLELNDRPLFTLAQFREIAAELKRDPAVPDLVMKIRREDGTIETKTFPITGERTAYKFGVFLYDGGPQVVSPARTIASRDPNPKPKPPALKPIDRGLAATDAPVPQLLPPNPTDTAPPAMPPLAAVPQLLPPNPPY